MTKYHISKDGTPGECHAKGACPLGGANEHFNSVKEAQAFSDLRNSLDMTMPKIKTDKEATDYYYSYMVEHFDPDPSSETFSEDFKENLLDQLSSTKDQRDYQEFREEAILQESPQAQNLSPEAHEMLENDFKNGNLEESYVINKPFTEADLRAVYTEDYNSTKGNTPQERVRDLILHQGDAPQLGDNTTATELLLEHTHATWEDDYEELLADSAHKDY